MNTEETTDTVYSTEELMEQLAMGHYPVSFKDSEKSYTLFRIWLHQAGEPGSGGAGKSCPGFFYPVFSLSSFPFSIPGTFQGL